jgi:hypothetical protein
VDTTPLTSGDITAPGARFAVTTVERTEVFGSYAAARAWQAEHGGHLGVVRSGGGVA